MLVLAGGLAAAGCSSTADETAHVDVPPAKAEWSTIEGCDPLVPTYCGYPFPSNVYTADDPESPTGRRVRMSAKNMPFSPKGVSDPAPWNEADGFSAGGVLLAQFPAATEEGLPTPETIEVSLGADSPTVVIDAETGERIAHFAEIDRSTSEDDQRSFMIRPVVRIEDGHRYIVAIRNVKSASGVIAPSPAFQALRDKLKFTDDPSIDKRRALYEDIFARLDKAGVKRDSLQLAWDFTTASRDNNTARMVHMRDEALELAGDAGPAYTITSVDTDYEPEQVAFRIHGTMKVPLYLDKPDAGAHLNYGADGLPEPNPSKSTYDVPFELLIPKSATAENPAALMSYGHGLLGSHTQIQAGNFRTLINQYNYAIFAVDLVGMSEDDVGNIMNALLSGKLETIETMFDRLHQGTLNNLLAMRMMKNAFSKDPTYGKLLDPTKRYYHGISQGGIFGGVYMALSTDVTRGVLEVMGQPYNLLLNRSQDFAPFFTMMNISYPDARDQQMVLGLIQMLWDRVEPSGYTKYIRENPLPNTPAHEVLLRAAVGDHQVATLGAHIMARAIGAKHIDSGVRDVFGLETVKSADSGSGYIEYDFGLPEVPICNIPMSACEDPHGELRYLAESQQALDNFLRTGTLKNFCEEGKCSFPALSGCTDKNPGDTCPELNISSE